MAPQVPGRSHHCWAYRLGWPPRERWADAGEPAGTAGEPMARVLAGHGLSDVLAIAVRWYGGIKLGKGGLARAYAEVVGDSVRRARLDERFPTTQLSFEVPYERIGPVKRLIKPPELELVDASYDEIAVLVVRVASWRERDFRQALADLGLAAQSP